MFLVYMICMANRSCYQTNDLNDIAHASWVGFVPHADPSNQGHARGVIFCGIFLEWLGGYSRE